MSKKAKVIVIGAGFGGLGAAGCFARAGHQVVVLEKNANVGGRANVFTEKGYTFDMGPSWFMCLDIWGHWFELMGEDMYQWLEIVKLDPTSRFIFKDSQWREVFVSPERAKNVSTFEQIESGSGKKLEQYLDNAKEKYEISMRNYLHRNYNSILDMMSPEIVVKGLSLGVFDNMQRHIERTVKTPELQKLLQYSMLFVGSSPYKIPALYSLITHTEMTMGIYYPMGGMYELSKAVAAVAEKQGAEIRVNTPVAEILVEDGRTTGVRTEEGEVIEAEIVISNADSWHTETALLAPKNRSHDSRYWQNLKVSASGYLLFLGIDGKVPHLAHHNFIAEADWKTYFADIFDTPRWPSNPSLYICAPSVTDSSVAPAGKENLFVLMPLAAGLSDTPEQRSEYRERILDLLETELGIENIRERIEVQRDFGIKDFADLYNSFQGNGLGGWAHTLMQSAAFRTNNYNPKVKNLYYAGASTNPGIGTMLALISGQLAFKRHYHIKHGHPLTPAEITNQRSK